MFANIQDFLGRDIGESLFHTVAYVEMDKKASFPHTGHGEGQLQPQIKAHCGWKGLQEYPLGTTNPTVAILYSWLSILFHLLSLSWLAEKLELFTPVKLRSVLTEFRESPFKHKDSVPLPVFPGRLMS